MKLSLFKRPARRRILAALAGLVAATLVVTQVLAELHGHDDVCPEEHCVLCAHSDPGVTPATVVAKAPQQTWACRTAIKDKAAPFIARPFANRFSRGPPLS